MTTRADKAAAPGDGLTVRDILWPELARFLLRGRIHRALVVEDGVLLVPPRTWRGHAPASAALAVEAGR